MEIITLISLFLVSMLPLNESSQRKEFKNRVDLKDLLNSFLVAIYPPAKPSFDPSQTRALYTFQVELYGL